VIIILYLYRFFKINNKLGSENLIPIVVYVVNYFIDDEQLGRELLKPIVVLGSDKIHPSWFR
jgi:hypothetical protein